MYTSEIARLIAQLMPRGDCWQFDRDSVFTRIVNGLSVEFESVKTKLDAMKDAFFPKANESLWKPTILFEAAPPADGLFTLSKASIDAQLKYYGITDVQFVAPPNEPFIIYVYMKVGDEKAESQIREIVPAFCDLKFVQGSPPNAPN